MVSSNPSLHVAALSVLLRAFGRVRASSGRLVARDAVSRPAVTVTSDYGMSPSFPGMR